MSQENVEIMRKGIDAWNQHDAGLWLSYAAPDVEWMPAGPAAVERTVYRGHDEVAGGRASQIPLDQEFAVHTRLRDGQVITVRSFLAWREALEAVALSE